ncbi:MAG: hypothetical protein J5I50_05515 [Chitinophagaceae bacterium]|nr:hypothetical protein [Chitinophagaceae bacterium]
MVKRIKAHISLLAIMMLTVIGAYAQDTQEVVASPMESNGKIYVVMTVCLVILIAFLAYLVRIDMKISKKEKEG